jgi:hypothetical protein
LHLLVSLLFDKISHGEKRVKRISPDSGGVIVLHNGSSLWRAYGTSLSYFGRARRLTRLFLTFPIFLIENVIEVKRLGPVSIPNLDRFFRGPFFKPEFLHHAELIHLGIVRKMGLIRIRLKSFAGKIVALVAELYSLSSHTLKYLALPVWPEQLDPAFLGLASFAARLLFGNTEAF